MIKLNLNIPSGARKDYVLSIIKIMLPAHLQFLAQRPYKEVLSAAKLCDDPEYLKSITPSELAEILAAASFTDDGVIFEGITIRNVHPRKGGQPPKALRLQWVIKPQKWGIEYLSGNGNWLPLEGLPKFDNFLKGKAFLTDFVAQKKDRYFEFEEPVS